jgi:hypothetical protein
MKKLILALGLLLSGCMQEEDRLPPVCFEQDNITYRSEILCPSPREVNAAVHRVIDVAICDIDVFRGYDVSQLEDEVINVDGVQAAGVTYLDLSQIFIANVDYKIPVLRHELFHVALDALTGDPDYYHQDPRWNEVN